MSIAQDTHVRTEPTVPSGEHYNPAVMPMARLCPREFPASWIDGPDMEDPTFWPEVELEITYLAQCETHQLRQRAYAQAVERDEVGRYEEGTPR